MITGSVEIDGTLLPKNPLTKTWQRQQQAIGSLGESIYADFWQLTLNFPTLHVTGQSGFLMNAFKANVLHSVKVPHPTTATPTLYTGASIESYSFTFGEADKHAWAVNPVMVLAGIKVV